MAPAEPVAAWRRRSPVNLDDHDYELDLTGCIGQGWNIFKENFGTLFLAFLVAMLVSIGFAAVVGGITSRMVFGPLIPGVTAPVALTVGYNYILKAIIFVVAGPVTAGCYLVFLRTIRREPTGVGDVFEGFQRCFLQLFLGGMVIALITGTHSICPLSITGGSNPPRCGSQFPTDQLTRRPRIPNALWYAKCFL